ncbi:hypothetical protein UPYG_G00306950 [Umbra pygmaea]|uniref:Guanine nucleotide exchange factor DBS-like n=1 Tax=Umbra pygmaea TaxID=75934 RepID=A0ABD0WLL7_UMBPY
MGGEEEKADSGVAMEEECELGFSMCEEGQWELSSGQMGLESSGRIEEEEVDWLNAERRPESYPGRQGELESAPGSSVTEERAEESAMNKTRGSRDTEKRRTKVAGRARGTGQRVESGIWMEGEMEDWHQDGEVMVRLRPAEEKRGMSVRISLEEVERYYRFSRCCYWLHNEVMQQENCPLRAIDITFELKKQFAFLSGGRGKNGSPIIVFPEFPAFGEIQEREFHNVLTYLTSVPSLSATGVGFILVIDRRQDRWAAVKGTLLRIAGSFPGNLQLVLVLRPTNILQRTLSDILFKFNKDEFKMKVPVIMLSSVTELHSYIDRTQLTTELGGTQQYCHESWLSHRTSIEGFAVIVKSTAQVLQSFGMELAETELPSDVQATTNLLATHANKKDRIKEDLLLALEQGSTLLESINEPVLREPDHNMNQDELENLATIQRLLSQLDDTERAFDEFWARHQTKLEQCLLLRHFEHNYREMMCLLDQVAEKLTAFSEVGISPAHAEHIFRELSCYEERVCEVLARAQALIREGDELILISHNAEDSIQPKCSDLRAVRQELSTKLTQKKDRLLKAIELHRSLERASKWYDDGIYLLASQPVDKFQSHEGAESALQEIERYLDTTEQNQLTDPSTVYRDYEMVLNQELREQVNKVFQKQVSMKEMFERRRISLNKLAAKQTRPVQPVAPRPEAFIKSPLSSPDERRWSEELLCVLQGYASEMDNPAMACLIPAPLQNKKDVLFGNMPEIYDFHKRAFLRELEEYQDCPELVGRCFLERMTDLQIYEKYCQNKPRSESLWRQCSDCAFFQECQKKLEHKLGLDSYLLKPVQRITKYQLLLKELLKYSKGCDGSDDLQVALSSILGILKAVNDSMHLIAITGYDGHLGDLGRLLMQGSFSVWTEHKKGHAKVKDLARFKPMQRHLFLHEKALLFCKRREENGEGYEKAPSYSFKQSLSMSAVGITENAKGDNKKFEVWCNSREEVYIVQAPTTEVKTTWVNEIRKVLTTQLEAYREASQQRPSDGAFQYPAPNGGPVSLSPFKRAERSMKEQKTEPSSPDPTSCSSPKTKGSLTSPEHKTKRHEIKSDPTPFGFKGWTKGSLSLDANEENDSYSSTEEPINSDPEDEGGKKLHAGKYMVVSDHEMGGAKDLSVKSGETVQLIREGEDGQWFVKNLKTKQEGWVAATNLLTLIGQSKSCQSLTSSEGSGSGNLSTSSSCCETNFSDIKP